MPLILVPSIKDGYTRADVEAFIEQVRARRMVAVQAFHNLKNARIEGKSAKISERVARQLQLMQKELDALERAEQKVEGRLSVIDSLSEEIELLQEGIVDTTPIEEND